MVRSLRTELTQSLIGLDMHGDSSASTSTQELSVNASDSHSEKRELSTTNVLRD